MACIDRFVMTSTRVQIRALSRTSVAWCSMVIHTVIWHLFGLHLLIMTTIIYGRCAQYGLYLTLYSIYNLLLFCLIPVTMMIIFGYMAYSDMKQTHMRVRPTENTGTNVQNNVSVHRIDREMLIMVIAEIVCYAIAMIVYPIIALETTISNYIVMNKNSERLQIEVFTTYFAQFLISINNAAPFYLYLVVSKGFRNEVKKFLDTCRRKLNRQPGVTQTRPTL